MDAGLPGCADLFLPDEWGMGSLEQGTLPFTSGVLDLAPALSWDGALPPTPAAFPADAGGSTWPQPSLCLPTSGLAQQPADSTAATSKAPRRSTSKKAAAKPATAAPGIAGGSSVGASRRGPTRQELRQQQQRQRAVEQQRIKELEQQLVTLRQQMQVGMHAWLRVWRRRWNTVCPVCCSYRVHASPLSCIRCCPACAPLLQSISIENKHLQQRQEALNATLDMQQQIRAAAAAAAAAAEAEAAGAASAARTISDSVSLRSEDGEEAFSFGFDSGDEAVERAGSIADSLLLGVTTGESSGTGEPEAAAAASGAADWQPHAAGAVATAAAMEDGPHGRPSGGSGWFFAATLVQHVRWYQQQVGALLASFPVFFCRRLAVRCACRGAARTDQQLRVNCSACIVEPPLLCCHPCLTPAPACVLSCPACLPVPHCRWSACRSCWVSWMPSRPACSAPWKTTSGMKPPWISSQLCWQTS